MPLRQNLGQIRVLAPCTNTLVPLCPRAFAPSVLTGCPCTITCHVVIGERQLIIGLSGWSWQPAPLHETYFPPLLKPLSLLFSHHFPHLFNFAPSPSDHYLLFLLSFLVFLVCCLLLVLVGYVRIALGCSLMFPISFMLGVMIFLNLYHETMRICSRRQSLTRPRNRKVN